MKNNDPKQRILAEIRRTATENHGKPLGLAKFEQSSGIRRAEWYGKFWKSWGDAVREAGLTANTLQEPIDETDVLTSYASLVRELGRIPVAADLRLKRLADKTIPSHRVFDRFGSKAQLITRAYSYCSEREEWADVATILESAAGTIAPEPGDEPKADAVGFVYLIHSGRYYKIGRTNSVGRREYELGIQLPEKVRTIHHIETDDPEGIEAYWHRRFADKRARGEWFSLTADDIRAFKRRRFQ